MRIVLVVIGLVLMMLGALAAVAGFAMSASANAAYYACLATQPAPPPGFCEAAFSLRSAYDAALVGGIVFAMVGLILAGVGLATTEVTQARPVGPPIPAPTAFQTPPCPVCGQPLSWIAQHNRWYCPRCGQYR